MICEFVRVAQYGSYIEHLKSSLKGRLENHIVTQNKYQVIKVLNLFGLNFSVLDTLFYSWIYFTLESV